MSSVSWPRTSPRALPSPSSFLFWEWFREALLRLLIFFSFSSRPFCRSVFSSAFPLTRSPSLVSFSTSRFLQTTLWQCLSFSPVPFRDEPFHPFCHFAVHSSSPLALIFYLSSSLSSVSKRLGPCPTNCIQSSSCPRSYLISSLFNVPSMTCFVS